MHLKHINAPDAAPPAGQYTQAVEVGGATRTLYVSGQVGNDAAGNTPPNFDAQCRLVWANLEAQLRAAGMGLDNIVKLVTIVPDPADVAASRVIRGEVLGARRPASTLIVAGLADPKWKIEIEAIAVA